MNLDELRRIREKLDADYQKRIEAIETVRQMIGELDRPSGQLDSRPTLFSAPALAIDTAKPAVRTGSIRDAIEQIISSLGDKTFTTKDIANALSESRVAVKTPTFKSIMTSLVKSGHVEVVEKGYGPNPNILRKRT